MKCPVTIQNSIENIFNNESLEKVLSLGLPLTDVSMNGFMKDFYPIKMFTIENAMKLLNNNKNDEYIYFLTFALWKEAIMNQNIPRSKRLYFLHISLNLFYWFYYQLKNTDFIPGITINKTQNTIAQYFNQEIFIIRCLNTIIFKYSLLLKYKDIALNRVGSHPLENFFGNIRSLCKNFDSYENFVKYSIKTYENLTICKKYNIKNKVESRINTAGVKLYSTLDYDFTVFNYLYSKDFCEEESAAVFAFLNSNVDFRKVFNVEWNRDKYDYFIKILSSSASKEISSTYTPKITSGSLTISRCICGNFETKNFFQKKAPNFD